MERRLKIATVDDLQAERDYLAEKLKDYMDSRWIKYELLEYPSGEAFVSALQQQRFDIVFMDIFMDGISGTVCAAKLRELDMDCKLVFLTSSRDFLEEGYAYNPCHYLVKPVAYSSFLQAMDNCRIQRQVAVPYLEIVSNGVPLRVDTTEIAYINVCRRTVLLHTATGDIPAGRGFAAVVGPLLQDSRFISCIKGVLVNMDYIVSEEESVFLMKNGERLQIALRDRKSVVRQYRSYQFERASARGRGCS